MLASFCVTVINSSWGHACLPIISWLATPLHQHDELKLGACHFQRDFHTEQC